MTTIPQVDKLNPKNAFGRRSESEFNHESKSVVLKAHATPRLKVNKRRTEMLSPVGVIVVRDDGKTIHDALIESGGYSTFLLVFNTVDF